MKLPGRRSIEDARLCAARNWKTALGLLSFCTWQTLLTWNELAKPLPDHRAPVLSLLGYAYAVVIYGPARIVAPVSARDSRIRRWHRKLSQGDFCGSCARPACIACPDCEEFLTSTVGGGVLGQSQLAFLRLGPAQTTWPVVSSLRARLCHSTLTERASSGMPLTRTAIYRTLLS